MREYESPFALPDNSFPEVADYERGDRVIVAYNTAKAWREWADYREAYVTAEDDNAREIYLRQMLETVTETNPPSAIRAVHPPVPERRQWNVTLPQVTLAALILVVIFLLCAIAII